MSNQKKSLFMQDIPGNLQTLEKSYRFKFRLRKKLFKVAFKIIESIWMVLQIIHYICEIFHM
jgi:hypothetical protein